jgi:hypothetical protein
MMEAKKGGSVVARRVVADGLSASQPVNRGNFELERSHAFRDRTGLPKNFGEPRHDSS